MMEFSRHIPNGGVQPRESGLLEQMIPLYFGQCWTLLSGFLLPLYLLAQFPKENYPSLPAHHPRSVPNTVEVMNLSRVNSIKQSFPPGLIIFLTFLMVLSMDSVA